MKCDKCGEEKRNFVKVVGVGLVCRDCVAKINEKLLSVKIMVDKKRKAGYVPHLSGAGINWVLFKDKKAHSK